MTNEMENLPWIIGVVLALASYYIFVNEFTSLRLLTIGFLASIFIRLGRLN